MEKHIRTGRRDWSELYIHKAKPRNKSLSLLVSEDEAKDIDNAAKAEGITRSAWLTKAAIARLQKTHGSDARGKGAAKTHGSDAGGKGAAKTHGRKRRQANP